MKTFIAVSSLIQNNKLVYLTTSKGENLFNENGITSLQAIEFLFELRKYRNHGKSNIIFVCYAFSRDNEFAFSLLPDELKDKLFQSPKITNYKETLEIELDAIKAEYYQTRDKEQKELLDFEKYVNELNIKELSEVKYYGYSLTLANGKFLTIRKNSKSITIYDVFKFFNKPLYDAVKQWLCKDYGLLKENDNLDSNFLRLKSDLETTAISEVTGKLNKELSDYGFSLSKFHGASALTSHILSRLRAKKAFYSYKMRHQTSAECYRSSKQSFYGARIEQLKIGTIKDVKVYDINSAYAYACLFLPKMLRKPNFTTTFCDEPFSWWFCEFDFTGLDLYCGLLPTRSKYFGNSLTVYPLRGKGYYYKPEIDFVLKHYPERIKIKQGFYVPFEQAEWVKEILAIYELRNELKKQNNPLEKVLKLALASIYGKFCQHNGRSYYYNLYYAGFITSKIRAILLESISQAQEKTICFLTDAVHTTDNLNIAVSDNIGDFSLREYEQGTYFNTGVYCLTDKDGRQKVAHQGFNKFDLEQALKDLKTKKVFSGLQELFTGWNVFSDKKIGLHQYLEYYQQNKKTNPFETFARLFELADVDLTESYIDSKIAKLYSGLESGLYKERKQNKESNFALDSIRAKRI